MSMRSRISTRAGRTALAGAALTVLVAGAGLTAVIANDDGAPPPVPTPVVDAAASAAELKAERQTYVDSLGVPDDLRSLPRKQYDAGLYQEIMPTFADMFGGGQDAAVAAVQGRVTKVLKLRGNRVEVEFDVSRVIAARPGVPIAPGPIVLVEGITFEGPPVMLVYNPRRVPLFPADEGIFLIKPFAPSLYKDQWIMLMDRGTYQVLGDKVTALTIGSDGNTEKVDASNEDLVDHNAVIDWGQKYRDYPLEALIGEIVSAAKAQGWVVE